MEATSTWHTEGYLTALDWAHEDDALDLAAQLAAGEVGEVTRNPHLLWEWATAAICAPPLVAEVHRLIGPELAVENTFLMVKRPGSAFRVPIHQDGINDRIQLDPARSVAVWLAISHATPANGCLEVAPGSHHGGYLPYRRAKQTTGEGRPLIADVDDAHFVPVPLRAGQAVAMDVRLLHRSGPNRSDAPRIGLNIRYVAPGAVTTRDGSPHPDLFQVATPTEES